MQFFPRRFNGISGCCLSDPGKKALSETKAVHKCDFPVDTIVVEFAMLVDSTRLA